MNDPYPGQPRRRRRPWTIAARSARHSRCSAPSWIARAAPSSTSRRSRRVGSASISLALVAAFGLTFGIVYVFDAFLTSMQKVMRMMDEQEERQQQEEAERKKKEPMPAYVVPPSD